MYCSSSPESLVSSPGLMRIFIMLASLAIESQAAAIEAVQSRTICVSLTKSSPVNSTTYIALKNVTHFSRLSVEEFSSSWFAFSRSMISSTIFSCACISGNAAPIFSSVSALQPVIL
uniref:Putative secreted protein n=1 Tax=Anopheles marajoara TaxID=58244 RepID=A0A2M4C7I3_9DIPT